MIRPQRGVQCWMCNVDGVDHACEEWDTGLHAKCVLGVLGTPEGQIVLDHGHEVRVRVGREELIITRAAVQTE